MFFITKAKSPQNSFFLLSIQRKRNNQEQSLALHWSKSFLQDWFLFLLQTLKSLSYTLFWFYFLHWLVGEIHSERVVLFVVSRFLFFVGFLNTFCFSRQWIKTHLMVLFLKLYHSSLCSLVLIVLFLSSLRFSLVQIHLFHLLF